MVDLVTSKGHFEIYQPLVISFLTGRKLSKCFFSLIVYFHDHMYTKMTFILNCIYCIPLQKECVSVHFGLRLFNNLAYLENFMKTTMLQLTDLNCKIKFKNLNTSKKRFSSQGSTLYWVDALQFCWKLWYSKFQVSTV